MFCKHDSSAFISAEPFQDSKMNRQIKVFQNKRSSLFFFYLLHQYKGIDVPTYQKLNYICKMSNQTWFPFLKLASIKSIPVHEFVSCLFTFKYQPKSTRALGLCQICVPMWQMPNKERSFCVAFVHNKFIFIILRIVEFWYLTKQLRKLSLCCLIIPQLVFI